MNQSENQSESLGLELQPGESHYRAYVGPPRDYDLIAAMTFNLLTTIGLRQHHSLLDVGCGSLRVGRLLIPYLNQDGYVATEPNEWLVKEGITNELGESILMIKRPRFFYTDSPAVLVEGAMSFDFACAQSIFSHCGPDLISNWLGGISQVLRPGGALLATFLLSDTDSETRGWIYPGCVSYKLETVAQMAKEAGLQFQTLDWRHPRQTWGLFAKAGFDASWFKNRSLSWNTRMDFINPGKGRN